MTAAQTIKTPVMVLPPRRGAADPLADLHDLARRLRRISLGEVVTGESPRTVASQSNIMLPHRMHASHAGI